MAGNYPDVPSWRFAYDRDGTQAYRYDVALGTITALTQANLRDLNDESTGGYYFQADEKVSTYLIFIFPEVRDLDAYVVMNSALSFYSQRPSVVKVSPNSTNGMDGVWTALSTPPATGSYDAQKARNNITSTTALGIKAVRFEYNLAVTEIAQVNTVHLFGEPVPGENPNRLVLWHPTEDHRVDPAHFDWGNVPRGSSQDRSFRVKNLSPALSSHDIRVAMETLTDGSPSIPSLHTLSYAGGSFLAQVNIGSLGPGAISTPITMRQVAPTNAQLGLWWFRVFAEAGSWS